MAELNKVLGALLRDVAQARTLSDLYARQVSKDYEADPLLRFFPIPRAEIKDITLDLKFAIATVDDDPDRTDTFQAKAEGHMQRLARTLVDQIGLHMEELAKRNAELLAAYTTYASFKFREQLNAYVIDQLLYLFENRDTSQPPRLESGPILEGLRKYLVERLPIQKMYKGFEIYEEKDRDDISELRFRLRDESGNIVLSSTRHFHHLDELKATVDEVLEFGKKATNYQMRRARNGELYFNLVNANRKLIARRIQLFETPELGYEEIRQLEAYFDSGKFTPPTTQRSGTQSLSASRKSAASPPQAPVFNEPAVRARIREATALRKTLVASIQRIDFHPQTPSFVSNPPLESILDAETTKVGKQLNQQLQHAAENSSDVKVELVVRSEDLQALPPESVSSLKITTGVKNYLWTHVEDDGVKSVRKLIPE